METVVTLLVIVGIYFIYQKGKSFYNKRAAISSGGKKLNQWGYLREIYKVLPSDPDEVRFNDRMVKIIYNFSPYRVFIIFKEGPSKKTFDDEITAAIIDNRLKGVASIKHVQENKKYSNLSLAVFSTEKHPNDLSEEFKNIINDYIENYESIAKTKLKSAYEEAGITIDS